MKHYLAKILSLFLVIGALFGLIGCGGDSVDYSHTIVFYHTQGDKLQKVTALAIASFEAKYPGWHVTSSQIGGYDEVKTKVVSDLAGHIQPDLAYCYADHVAQYLKTGKVVDIATLIHSTETIDTIINGQTVPVQIGYTQAEIDDFVPGFYAEGFAYNYGNYEKYGFSDTSILTMPFSKSTELLYVNETALIKAGIVDANGNAKVATTWKELWDQAAILKEKYPTCTPLGYDSEANWFITMCEQNDWGYTSSNNDNHYLFNNENCVDWLDELREYYLKGHITTQQDYGSYTSNLFTKGTEESGVIYCVGSSGGASYQATDKFKYGVYPIPGSPESETSNPYAAISQGPSLVMLSTERSENVDEKQKMTFLFMKELLDPTFQASFSIASGYCAVRKSTSVIDAYKEHMEGSDITAVAARTAASMADRYFSSPAFVGSSVARSQVGTALYYVITGQKDGTTALSGAYKACGGK